jgi:phytoene desaturase
MNQKTAIVIGAGIAGIAVSIRLAVQGYKVKVFEANPYLGGKLAEFELEGYRFDAGPSLFTMPSLVEALFRLAGEDPQLHFPYKKLDEVCRYFYEDGTIINAWADKHKFAAEVEAKTGEPAHKIIDFLRKSEKYYDLVGSLFLNKSLHKWSTFLNSKALKAIMQIPQLGIFRTMHQANKSYFKDSRVVQLFNRFATYNGSDPYQTPALLNIIPHLEHNIGAFFPLKGMYHITNSLTELAKRQGVAFITHTPVQEIITRNDCALGIKANGKEHYSDLVVSNMDVVNTYRKLLPGEIKPQRLLKQPKSSSALIFYWGIKRSFNQLDLHNIFFSEDYKKEFEHIFQHKIVYADPTVYINITSKHKPEDAPEGCENWFVMINVPNNSGQDWSRTIQEARTNICSKLSRILQVDINELIACEAVLDPVLIEARTSSSQGALYGNSSNNKYAAFLRHANFSDKISNLYFCGGSVHPGGGIPLSLLSGKITADLIMENA